VVYGKDALLMLHTANYTLDIGYRLG
jgi:hypothetical protein